MGSEPALLGLYRARLLRRELTLLASYYAQGRRPRILCLAYWRASFIPLVVPLLFFALRGLGFPEPQAALVACSAFLGLMLADMQIFVMNAGNWIFAKQALNWGQIAAFSRSIAGKSLDTSKPAVNNRWDQIRISPADRQFLAKTYLNMRKRSPDMGNLLIRSPEASTLLIATVVALAVVWLRPEFTGFTLLIYCFLMTWPAKRLKAAIDFRITWPVLREAFDWEEVERLAGRRL